MAFSIHLMKKRRRRIINKYKLMFCGGMAALWRGDNGIIAGAGVAAAAARNGTRQISWPSGVMSRTILIISPTLSVKLEPYISSSAAWRGVGDKWASVAWRAWHGVAGVAAYGVSSNPSLAPSNIVALNNGGIAYHHHQPAWRARR